MIWPFSRKDRKQSIKTAEIAVAEARTKRFTKLFELDTHVVKPMDNALDAMVRQSLGLLKPGPKQ